jgi:6-phosphogluconolactonase
MGAEFRVLATPALVAEAGANTFVAAAREAVDARGRFLVALSGGRTPHLVYHLLRAVADRSLIPWSRVEFFWSDERAVSLSDPASNAGEARRALLDQIPDVLPAAIHPLTDGHGDLDAAARAAEAEIRRVTQTPAPALPVLDLVWLGLGADGHTASLFPGSAVLDETDRLVAVCDAPPATPGHAGARLTMTLPLLNAAREVTFMVTGPDKADALARIRHGDLALPAARVAAARTAWLVDAAAAGVGE